MIHMIVIFLALTLGIALLYGAWKMFDKEERYFALEVLFKGALFGFIALVILFVIVNLF